MNESVRLETHSTRPAVRLPYLVAYMILFNQRIVLNSLGFGETIDGKVLRLPLTFNAAMQDRKLSDGMKLVDHPPGMAS